MIPWAYIDETNGIVHNHDHSMMAIFKFRGLDTASATPEELIAYNAAINNAMRRLPSGKPLKMLKQPTLKVAISTKVITTSLFIWNLQVKQSID